MTPCRATIEPLGVGGDVYLVRVHRLDEFEADALVYRRPRYFGACYLVRDHDSPSTVDVMGFVVRDTLKLCEMFDVVRAMEWAAAGVGLRHYRFERSGRRKPVLRKLPTPEPKVPT